jgi:hypothetical protein
MAGGRLSGCWGCLMTILVMTSVSRLAAPASEPTGCDRGGDDGQCSLTTWSRRTGRSSGSARDDEWAHSSILEPISIAVVDEAGDASMIARCSVSTLSLNGDLRIHAGGVRSCGAGTLIGHLNW